MCCFSVWEQLEQWLALMKIMILSLHIPAATGSFFIDSLQAWFFT